MASTFLSTTLGTPTSSRIWTFSTWLKRGGLNSTQHIFSIDSGSNRDAFSFDSDNGLRLYFNGSATGYADLSTNRVLRDTSAFYHLVIAVDTTQSTAANRVKLYINGTQYTWDETTIFGDQNYDTFNASGSTFRIGRDRTDGNYFDGILAHTHFVDGTQYAASTFGESDSTSGIWTPKTAPSVTYGNNGFFLKFENSGNLDLDSSGNSRSFTTSGTLTQNVDTPSNNFATLNPLHKTGGTALNALTNGNLTYTGHSSTSYSGTYSSIAASSGKYYAEFKCTGGGGAHDMMIGAGNGITNTTAPGASSNDLVVFGYDGKYYNGGSGVSWGGSSWTSGDIIGVAMDLDNNKLYVSKNGTYMNSGNPTSGSSGTGALTLATSSTGFYHFLIGDYGGDGTPICDANFGQGYFGTTQVASAGTAPSEGGVFEYDCPSGFQSLSTKGINSF